jgi:hypothetical protein
MKSFFVILLSTICLGVQGQVQSYAAYLRLGMNNINDSRDVLPLVVPEIGGFKKGYYGIGGEFEFISNRIVLDGEISIMTHGPVGNGTRYVEPSTAALIGKTGFTLIENRRVMIYPAFGAGFNSLFLNTYTKKDGLKSDRHFAYLITPTIDMGVHGDVIIYRFRNTPSTGILPVGVRTGYRFTTLSDKWKRTSGTNISRQLFANSGWYFSVALGIGYYSE